jgi:hypothetical protein
MGQQNIWNKDISPYIKKSVNVIDADTLWKEMLDDIAKWSFSVAKKKQLTEELTQFIDDLKVNYPKGINQQESHLLTSERWKDLESVFKKVGKDVAATPVTNEYKWIVLAARWKLRDKLYTSMENAFKDLWVSKKMIKQKMVDYGNLWKVVAQSEKDLQQRFLWWVLWASSAAIKKVGTPVTTILGKWTYTAWKALQYIPKQIIAWATKWAKAIMKWLKEVVKWWSIFTIFQDWTIIPWSPTNIAQEAIDINKEYSKNPENFVEWEWMLWRKWEIEKAIEKNKKDATMEWEFIDRFGQRRVLRNWEVKTLY